MKVRNMRPVYDEDEAAEDPLVQKARRRQNRRLMIAAMACFFLIASLVLYAAGVFKPRNIDGLVKYCIRRGGAVPAVLIYSYVGIDDRLAEYHRILQVHSEDLNGYAGEVYVDDVYRPRNTKSLKYLIFNNGEGKLSIWEFNHFIVRDTNEFNLSNPELAHGVDLSKPLNLTPYTYADVAKVLYGMTGPEDIERITIRPPNFDNSREGKAIQKEIGLHTVKDREAIETFYDVLTRTVCLGASKWDTYVNLPDRFRYSFSPEDPEGDRTYQDRQLDGEQMRAERYLTVRLIDGTILDHWHYDAIKGCFHENYGVATKPLSEADVYALNAIFGIE